MERKQYVKIPLEKEIEVILTEKILGRIEKEKEQFHNFAHKSFI
jgi:hypothetical protein